MNFTPLICSLQQPCNELLRFRHCVINRKHEVHFYVLDFLPFWWPLILGNEKEFKEEYAAFDTIQYPCRTKADFFFFFVNETGPEFSPRLLLVFCFVVLFLVIKASASLTEVNILYQHFCFGLLNQLLVWKLLLNL